MARAEGNLVAQTDYYSDTTQRWYLDIYAGLSSLQGSGALQYRSVAVVWRADLLEWDC